MVLPLRMPPGTVSSEALDQINRLYWHKMSSLPGIIALPTTAIPPAVAPAINSGLGQCKQDECMGHLAGQAGFKRVAWGWVVRTPTDGYHVEARLVNAKGVLIQRTDHGCYSCDQAQLMGGLVDWELVGFNRAPPGEGTLYVSSRPKGARVLIDGEEVGVTPLRGIKLEVGKHFVDVWTPGRKHVRREVTIKSGRESRVGIRLKKQR